MHKYARCPVWRRHSSNNVTGLPAIWQGAVGIQHSLTRRCSWFYLQPDRKEANLAVLVQELGSSSNVLVGMANNVQNG